MSLVDFGNILKFFGGTEPSPEEQKVLFKEAALMALARATSADTNIKQVELEHVQGLLLEATGEEFSRNSLDNVLRVHHVVPTEWVLIESSISMVARGTFHGSSRLFAEDGTLLATANQSGIARTR